jgi:hypothetical protein
MGTPLPIPVTRPGSRDVDRFTLLRADPSELVFEGARRARPALLLVPMLLILSILPWWGQASASVTRVMVSGALVSLALLAVRRGAPRRGRWLVRPQVGELLAGATRLQLGRSPRWVLSTHSELSSPSSVYSADLEFASGERRTLLRHSDPARLLRQLSEALRAWPIPVECGWGLPAATEPWRYESSPVMTPPGRDIDVTVVKNGAANASLEWALGIMAILVIIDLIFLVSSEGVLVENVHPLSVALPLVVGGVIGLLAIGITTLERRWVIGRQISAESRALARSRVHYEAPVTSIRGVFAVGSQDAENCHVLVDSGTGPLALEVTHAEAPAFLERTRVAIHAAVARL